MAKKLTHFRDPYLNAIIDGLAGPLDHDLFEESVPMLLRPDHPGIVPIPGGADKGMDGAFADGHDSFCPVVTTTAEDVRSNLRRNLDRYIKEGLPCRKAIFATSRALDQDDRVHLQRIARERGFTLPFIYDRLALAQRLYPNPDITKELLDISGAPASLSALPLGQRSFLDIEAIGREKELEWLRKVQGDKLLIGQPGTGKTFLLYKLVQEGRALFVVGDDLTQIANDLRATQTPAVIIDDAHVHPELLEKLCHVRDTTFPDLQIIASCWPYQRLSVERILQIPKEQSAELEYLELGEMAAIIRAAGLVSPEEHIAFIQGQAVGRPGLAVAFVSAYLNRDFERLNSGEALLEETMRLVEDSRRDSTMTILAAFALGGDAGMPVELVARELHASVPDLKQILAELDAGGIVEERYGHYTIHPPMLQHALIRAVFFPPGKTPWIPDGLIAGVPSINQLTKNLIAARSFRGASIPFDYLAELLRKCLGHNPWIKFAESGPREYRWVLEVKPDLVGSLSVAGLQWAPEQYLTYLMEAHEEGGDAISWGGTGPLDTIRQWIQAGRPNIRETVQRRRLVFESARDWLKAGKELDTGISFLCLALSPKREYNKPSVDDAASWIFGQGVLGMVFLQQIMDWWPESLSVFNEFGISSAQPIRTLIQEWVYPGHGSVQLSDEQYNEMRAFAKKMLEDVAPIFHDRPGTHLWMRDLADRLHAQFDLETDPSFWLLFSDDRADDYEDYKRQKEERWTQIRALAHEWKDQGPVEIAKRLAMFQQEAASGAPNNAGGVHVLCSELAVVVAEPLTWGEAFMEEGVASHCASLFFSRAATEDVDGFSDIAEPLINDDDYGFTIRAIILQTQGIADHLVAQAVEDLEGMERKTMDSCARGEIPDDILQALLHHENKTVAGAAAIGEWEHEPHGNVRTQFKEAFHQAILQLEPGELEKHAMDSHLRVILKSDTALATQWLQTQLSRQPKRLVYLDDHYANVAAPLSKEQRQEVIKSLEGDLSYERIAIALVDQDVELYQTLLSQKVLPEVHLAPLHREPVGYWSDMVHLALSAGYSHEQISSMLTYSPWGDAYVGSEVPYWYERIQWFRKLCDHNDADIQAIGHIGLEHAEHKKQEIEREEKQRRIRGYYF